MIATTGALLALAAGGTLAGAVVLSESQDSHGDAVSAAAHDCRASAARTLLASGARNHGQCVSAVASSKAENEENDRDAHGDAVSAAAHSCPRTPPGAHGKCVSAVAQTHPTH
ncbi:MAG TPA: hypothetical protein VK131_14075 [Candidatus Acidoferrales bacterium]|nr:hypothetical protein [Candidatus Acidoferrales bacterium]